MLTLTTAILLILIIIIALYAFGMFDTPYLDAFRVAFYLLLVLLLLSVWFGVKESFTADPHQSKTAQKSVVP